MIQAITQQLKRFADDERAVSPVVGFVLIFALIMIVFTIYQAEVVPAQNAEVEFKHSQEVVGEMSRLNDAMDQAGASGISQSATIDTGVQYPNRALAINPGAPAGSLKTSTDSSGNPFTVTIKNVKATGENAKYFDELDAFTFESKELVYSIGYNVYQQDPTIVIAPGMQFAEFQDGSLVQSTSIITGSTIDLTLLGTDSDYQQSAMTASVDVASTSTATDYMTIESMGSNPEIVIETSLTLNEEAEENLEDRLEDKTNVRSAIYDESGSPNKVKIILKDKTYQLRVSEVEIGTVSEREQYYLTSEDSTTNPTVKVGESETLTVSVHDKLGNPDTATVDAHVVTGSGTFARSGSDRVDNIQTDDNGQVSFTYVPDPADADADAPVKIKLTLDGGSTDTVTLPDGTTEQLNTVIYELDVSDNSDDTGNSNDIGGDIDNGYALPESRRVTIDSATASGKDSVEFEFSNGGDTDMTVRRIQFSGYVGHFPSGDFATGGTFADTAIELNGPTVTLTSPFTVEGGETVTKTLSSLDVSKLQTGLLIISVKYEYTEDGTVKTDTATYSVPVLK